MFRYFFKTAARNILKYKFYSFINIAGFALGLASCIMILLYISYELSYDNYYTEADNIYRVSVNGALGDNVINHAVTPPPLGHTLVNEFPEVLNAVRIMPTPDMLIRNGDDIYIENHFLWTDSTFFQVFDYNLILGDPKTVLNDHHTVVLTEKTALKYFGRIDVVGEILEFEDFTPYKISGICKNPPENTHLKFDILASLSSLGFHNNPYWLNHTFHTYLLLNSGTDPLVLQDKLHEIVKKYVAPQLEPLVNKQIDKFYADGGKFDYELMNIKDIHLHSTLDYEIETNSDIKYIFIFSLIALFLLVIASINFMNLSTARASTRGREVGVKKVLGSQFHQLVAQFLGESIIFTTIAMFIALIIVFVLFPYFKSFTGLNMESQFLSEWYFAPAIVVTILIVGILSGIYPAFYLSKLKPVAVLKTSLASTGKGSHLRKALVVFQFSIAIFLIISTYIIRDQMNFIQTKNLGWNKDQVLVIKRAWAIEDNEDAVRNEMLANPNILTFSTSGAVPGKIFGTSVFNSREAPRTEQHLLSIITSKAGLDKTFQLEMLDGRFFTQEFTDDTNAVILNEAAVKELALADPVGKQLRSPGNTPDEDRYIDIIGVVKDFHFESLHHKIRPLLIFKHGGWPNYISMKIKASDVRGTLNHIQKVWKQFIPAKPLEYFFMDDEFAKLYEAEQRTSDIFSIFSLLTILIACLGLFGLATFTTIQRSKEIGIRKSLGASISGIVYLLSKEFSLLVILANFIAWPAAYYFINAWLNNFEYKISLTLLYFVIAALIALGIAFLTISYRSLRAALANPVDSLKYE